MDNKGVADVRDEHPVDKFVRRYGTKPRIYGVHQALFPRAAPGESVAGWYVREKGNLETCKEIHREELKCLRLMRARIKLEII
jgi:hypothetical protein